MKKLICILMAASMLVLAGCNGGNSDTGDDTQGSAPGGSGGEETPAPDGGNDTPDDSTGGAVTMVESFGNNPAIVTSEYTYAVPAIDMTEEEQRRLMIDNSLMTLGDTSRMANVLRKAAAGEEITIGFIGGSITEGLTAGENDCYAKLTYDALCEMFPDTKINYVNAGLSGTNSALGIVRAERDLYSEYTPDIVFIEYAVNNGGEQMDKDSYESLARKILEKDNNPAVVLLFTVLENRYSAQPWMTMVGEHYDLPMISVGDALNPMFDAGLMEWSKYSDDQSHPNYWGHKLVKDFIMNYFEQVKEIADGDDGLDVLPDLPEEAVFSYAYKDMELLERDQLDVTLDGDFKEADTIIATFNNGWVYKTNGGGSISFTADFKTLFLVFHCNNSEGFADAEVYIDGVLVNSVPSGRESGWGNPEADLAWSTTEDSASHEVVIKIAESDSRMYYGLVGIGISK